MLGPPTCYDMDGVENVVQYGWGCDMVQMGVTDEEWVMIWDRSGKC